MSISATQSSSHAYSSSSSSSSSSSQPPKKRPKLTKKEAVQLKPGSMGLLSAHVQKHILRFLPTEDKISFGSTAKTQREFLGSALVHDAVLAGRLLRQPELGVFWNRQFASYGPSIKRASIIPLLGSSEITFDQVDDLHVRAPTIEHLDFGNFKYDRDIADALAKLPNLRSLSGFQFNPYTIRRIREERIQIEHLEITGTLLSTYYPPVTIAAVDTLMQLPLKTLRIKLDDTDRYSLDAERLSILAKRGDIIQELQITPPLVWEEQNDELLSTSFPNLERLQLGFLSDNLLRKIAHGNFAHLRSLILEDSGFIDIKYLLEQVKERFPLLCEIGIQRCTDEDINILATFPRPLQLHLTCRLDRITLKSLKLLLSTHHHFKCLKLKFETFEMTETVAQSSAKIDSLSIGCYFNYTFSDKEVLLLAKSQLGTTDLELASYLGENNITNAGVKALAQGTLPLKRLHIETDSPWLNQEGIDAALTIPTLEHLYIKVKNSVIYDGRVVTERRRLTLS